MTFRLALAADLSAELSRIEHQELELAFGELGAPDARAIHEARKHIKKLRALLQVMRPALGKADHTAIDGSLRHAGRSLSGSRDRAALLECFDRLADSMAARAYEGVTAEGMAALRAQLDESGAADAPGVSAARDILASLLSSLEERRLKVGRRELVRGLTNTYARGRRRFRRLQPSSPVEAFHDLRKQVKYHQQQLSLIEGAWPEPLSGFRREADRLGETLGEHHDLALLEAALARVSSLSEGGMEALRAAQQHLPSVKRALEAEALAAAARLYLEPARAFGARIAGYLALAHSGGVAT